jgi:hypothetical protein
MAEQKFDLDALLMSRVAALAIGGSTLRGMVGAGGVEHARAFCRDEDILRRVGKRSTFAAELDQLTKELAACLPPRGRKGGGLWGPARKTLNIVLSDASLSYRLLGKYRLCEIEDLLEIPLDSQVVSGIRSDYQRYWPDCSLPRITGVVHTTPRLNATYQSAAQRIAIRRSVPCRIRLDLLYWRANEQ